MKISTQKEKTSKLSIFSKIGIFSASLLAASGAVYLYSPVIGTHADSSATADINLTVGEVMSLTLNTNALNLSTNPNSFVSGVITATVSTNSQYGYTLALEDVDSDTNMVHTNENIDAVVTSSFSGKKTSAEMDANTWGFSLDATDFYKVPANGSAVALKRTTTPMATESESTDVTFGAKVGNLTSGTYTDKVLFTMYVNGQDGKPTDPTGQTNPSNPSDPGEDDTNETRTLADIETLQDLYTTRGGTPIYDYETKVVESEDIYSESNTKRSKICKNTAVGTSKVLRDSRDGTRYTVKKLADGNCWMVDNLRISDMELTSANSDIPRGEAGYTLAASSDGNMGFTYNPGHSGRTDADSVHIDETYGGYYTFKAATAGWGTSEALVGSSPRSICPRGWRLPTGGDNSDFSRLTAEYNTVDLLRGEPNFVASGLFNGAYETAASITNAGDYSYHWSGTVQETYEQGDYAYNLSLSSRYGIMMNYSFKNSGFAIHCIAR